MAAFYSTVWVWLACVWVLWNLMPTVCLREWCSLTLQLDDSTGRKVCFKMLVRQTGTESTQEQFIRNARMPVLNSSVGDH